MEKTVDFYSNVLGMPLIKSLDLPGGMGQHFFFDAGNGDCVAFFWFADAPDRVPGHIVARGDPGNRGHRQRGEHDEPPGVPRSRGEVRRVPATTQGQGRAGRPRAQPRRERGAGLGDAAPRRLCALVLLPRPGRNHSRVRLLDQGIHGERHRDRAEDRRRTSPPGVRRSFGTTSRSTRSSRINASWSTSSSWLRSMSPASHVLTICTTPPTAKCAVALPRSVCCTPSASVTFWPVQQREQVAGTRRASGRAPN